MTVALSFEWDEQKRQQTIAKHLIDFKDAVKIFQAAVLVSDSAHPEEERKIAVGLLGEVEIVVIFTVRDSCMRIITARRARVNERRIYHAYVAGRGLE